MLNAIAATGIAVISVSVVYGWLAGVSELTQINPRWAPMQFNTALCFLEFSLALLFARVGRWHLVIPFGIMALTVSVLTLVQYISGQNFGIDEAFKMAYITVRTSDPGRMAPGTAAAFILSGVGLLLKRVLPQIVKPCGVAVLVIGTTCLLGYFTGLRQLYSFGPMTDMAIHTAIGFILLGMGIIDTAHKNQAG